MTDVITRRKVLRKQQYLQPWYCHIQSLFLNKSSRHYLKLIVITKTTQYSIYWKTGIIIFNRCNWNKWWNIRNCFYKCHVSSIKHYKACYTCTNFTCYMGHVYWLCVAFTLRWISSDKFTSTNKSKDITTYAMTIVGIAECLRSPSKTF